MKRKRRIFASEFKLKVILYALKEREPLSQLAQKFDIHPNQISKWKNDFLDNAQYYLQSPNSKHEKDQETEIENLYSKIGKLQMENDFLKKKLP